MKSKKIQKLTETILDEALVDMKKNIKKALTCGALDTEAWDEKNAPMILPKIIAIAVLESEANQYKAEGTSFEKQVSKDVKNLKFFI